MNNAANITEAANAVANTAANSAMNNGANGAQAQAVANAAANAVLNGVAANAGANAKNVAARNGMGSGAAQNIASDINAAVSNVIAQNAVSAVGGNAERQQVAMPLKRKYGTQPTVNDIEVELAAQKQLLAPAGAAPPLVVASLQQPNASDVLHGAPVRYRNSKVHNGAPPPEPKPHPRPQSLQFAMEESKRRVQLGGFLNTAMGSTSGHQAVGPRDPNISDLLPYVPPHMRSRPAHEPGAHFLAEQAPEPRYAFALDSSFKRPSPARIAGEATVRSAAANGAPIPVANMLGAEAMRAINAGNDAEAVGNHVQNVALANGMGGSAANTVANSAANALVTTLANGGNVEPDKNF